MVDKYILIKEYPNSEKLGTIFELNPSWKDWRVKDDKGSRSSTEWTDSYFKNWVGIYFKEYTLQEIRDEKLNTLEI
jgi:hypothetical protein